MTIKEVEDAIEEAGREAARATSGQLVGSHDGEYVIALSNLAIAKALLLQAEKQDELNDYIRSIVSGGNKYLEVRTVEG